MSGGKNTGIRVRNEEHKASYFYEGWAWECECGAHGNDRTKGECEEQYAAHKREAK